MSGGGGLWKTKEKSMREKAAPFLGGRSEKIKWEEGGGSFLFYFSFFFTSFLCQVVKSSLFFQMQPSHMG